MHSTTAIAYCPAYPDDPLRHFDWYPPHTPLSPAPPLLCFVHGGAWRAEDKAQHALLAHRLVSSTGCPVAVINYRLTPPDNLDPALRHPMHTRDLLQFLLFLTQSAEHQHPLSPYDKNSIILIGHSCSAHMISCLLLRDGLFDAQFDRDPASQDVLRAVKGVVLSEGIYDLDTLVARFPDYTEWFVQPAFGPPPYAQFSALRFPPREHTDRAHWLLLHSPKDTLVNVEQTTEMHEHLLAVSPHPDHIHLNTHDLEQDHDDVLYSDTYIHILHKFISEYIHVS